VVEGQSLLLLAIEGGIGVRPIDDSQARRLKALALGQTITLTPHGD
jgi:hypothetical protein